MPTFTFTKPDPHPSNPLRTFTLSSNTDCPRCGFDCGECEFDGPDSRLHCPGCKKGLVTAGRNDWPDDVSQNHSSSWWFDALDWDVEAKGDPECCAGCELLSAQEAE